MSVIGAATFPVATANARSAASGLENTNVDERRWTAGRADPTDNAGSNPRVRRAVRGRTIYVGLGRAISCFMAAITPTPVSVEKLRWP